MSEITAPIAVAQPDRAAAVEKAKYVGKRSLIYTLATFFSLFAAIPFAWMVFTIFKQNTDLYAAKNNPFKFNDPPTLANLRLLFNDTKYTTFLYNTLFVSFFV